MDGTSIQEISDRLGVTEKYAKQLRIIGNNLSPNCGICANETYEFYLLRLSDSESPRYFGRTTSPKNCIVAVHRICLSCQANLGESGIHEHFKKQALQGNTIKL